MPGPLNAVEIAAIKSRSMPLEFTSPRLATVQICSLCYSAATELVLKIGTGELAATAADSASGAISCRSTCGPDNFGHPMRCNQVEDSGQKLSQIWPATWPSDLSRGGPRPRCPPAVNWSDAVFIVKRRNPHVFEPVAVRADRGRQWKDHASWKHRQPPCCDQPISPLAPDLVEVGER